MVVFDLTAALRVTEKGLVEWRSLLSLWLFLHFKYTIRLSIFQDFAFVYFGRMVCSLFNESVWRMFKTEYIWSSPLGMIPTCEVHRRQEKYPVGCCFAIWRLLPFSLNIIHSVSARFLYYPLGIRTIYGWKSSFEGDEFEMLSPRCKKSQPH